MVTHTKSLTCNPEPRAINTTSHTNASDCFITQAFIYRISTDIEQILGKCEPVLDYILSTCR